MTTTADVAIIGGGPIGIELAVALRGADLTVAQFEAGAIGSTIGWWAPGTQFFSSPERIEIAGVPLVTPDQRKATREDYLGYLRGVVAQFHLDVRTWERVDEIRRDGDEFVLTTAASAHGVGGPDESAAPLAPGSDVPRHVTRARTVVLAHGNMHHPRRLEIPGVDLPHVSHYFDEPHRYFAQNVLIVGGKNSAVEAALRCYRIGARVTMSYRGDGFDPSRVKYWLRPEIEWLIGKGRIGWHPGTTPVRIEREAVTLEDGTGSTTVVPADTVLLMTGYVQDSDLFEQLGVEQTGDALAPVHDRATMETNVPGVYVAGTAVGGSQRRARIFIENSHVHVERIVRALTGRTPAWTTDAIYGDLEEA